jgi:hypothetical protein
MQYTMYGATQYRFADADADAASAIVYAQGSSGM